VGGDEGGLLMREAADVNDAAILICFAIAIVFFVLISEKPQK
jgi:hypothetical protein